MVKGKAHIGADADSGLVHSLTATAAHVSDVSQASKLITGEEDIVYGDSGYLGLGKREDAVRRNQRGRKIRYKISRRPWPGVQEEWAGIATLVEYKCLREIIGEEKTRSTRYYISSLTCSAEEMARYLRNHSSIENRLHWMLDVMFEEDASPIRTYNTPENLNVLRKVALTLVRNTATPKKLSTKSKMTKAALSTAFLAEASLRGLSTC